MTLEPTVEIEVVLERFPASVRGAFVLRGLDADPHQVDILEASVVEVANPTRAARPLELPGDRTHVPPREEMLVPFEVFLAGLDAGWYRVRAEAEIDGLHRIAGPTQGPRFLVPWPRGSTRRGPVASRLKIKVPRSGGATVERVECRSDSSLIRWRHASTGESNHPEFGELRVLADGKRIPVLESSFDPATGERTTIAYPLLK
ncbi:MAG: hypothetical protein ACRDH6_06870, partial [Actinomycetota bacterium]